MEGLEAQGWTTCCLGPQVGGRGLRAGRAEPARPASWPEAGPRVRAESSQDTGWYSRWPGLVSLVPRSADSRTCSVLCSLPSPHPSPCPLSRAPRLISVTRPRAAPARLLNAASPAPAGLRGGTRSLHLAPPGPSPAGPCLRGWAHALAAPLPGHSPLPMGAERLLCTPPLGAQRLRLALCRLCLSSALPALFFSSSLLGSAPGHPRLSPPPHGQPREAQG